MKKKKVGTLLDEELLRRAKRRAAERSQPLNELIQEAVAKYLSESHQSVERDAAFHVFCREPMRIERQQLAAVLESDPWSE